jgi:hypothetical protein
MPAQRQRAFRVVAIVDTTDHPQSAAAIGSVVSSVTIARIMAYGLSKHNPPWFVGGKHNLLATRIMHTKNPLALERIRRHVASLALVWEKGYGRSTAYTKKPDKKNVYKRCNFAVQCFTKSRHLR